MRGVRRSLLWVTDYHRLMPNRESLIQAWLAAEKTAVAAERELADVTSPTKAELTRLFDAAQSRRRVADSLFKQVYAAVKDEARP